MLRALSTALLLIQTVHLYAATAHTTSACPQAAADRSYRPLTFRSVEARDKYGTEHDLLGIYAPNPLCYLKDIATRAAGQSAVDGHNHALRGVYTLSAHACMADTRAGDHATHESVCELPRIVALFQTPIEGSGRMLRELALQNALKTTAAWIQTRPHRSPYMDARAPVASAELWTDRPVQAARALFTTFTCADDTEPLRLNTCRLQKDVLALALNQALKPVVDTATLALDRVRHSRRPEDSSLKAVLMVAEASDEVVRLLSQGVPLTDMVSSRLPRMLDHQLHLAQPPESDMLARAATQSTEELASLVRLGAEAAAYVPSYPAIASAQFARVRETPEMNAVVHALTDRGALLTNVLIEYLGGRLRLSSAQTLVP